MNTKFYIPPYSVILFLPFRPNIFFFAKKTGVIKRLDEGRKNLHEQRQDFLYAIFIGITSKKKKKIEVEQLPSQKYKALFSFCTSIEILS